jgi:predicted MPP superfamily phosphohydrolase
MFKPDIPSCACRRWSRRRILGGIAVAAAGIIADECWWESRRLVVERLSLAFPDLPPGLEGLRMVQLSDLHRSAVVGQREIEHAVARANSLAPDLMVLTGDYVTLGRQYAEPCAAALSVLRAPLGRYAILGNHDHGVGAEAVAAALRHAGLTVLRNQAQPVGRGGADLWLIGMDDATFHKHDVGTALQGVPDSGFKVALMHEPDLADEIARYPVQLQLSGHSHGGQICLPGIGPLHLPKLGRRYPTGLYRVGPLRLYTNRGVGRIRPAVRFNCPPEITLITLRRA